MGHFSWKCKRCGKSLLSAYAVSAANGWMKYVVAQTPEGATVVGEYDGYGRIDDGEETHEFGGKATGVVEFWHRDCWIIDGQPSYSGPSDFAEDQGYFFEDDEYDIPSPLEELIHCLHLGKRSTMLTDAEYIASRGSTCPSCHSNNLEAQGWDGETKTQDVFCKNCGMSYWEEYKLVGYSFLGENLSMNGDG